jgi:hypothetical protein
MEEQAIMRLLEIDTRATEIQAKREKELALLEKRLKDELQQTARHLNEEIQKTAEETRDRITREAREKVEQINAGTAAILHKMEEEFEMVKKDIEQEVLKKIFSVER